MQQCRQPRARPLEPALCGTRNEKWHFRKPKSVRMRWFWVIFCVNIDWQPSNLCWLLRIEWRNLRTVLGWSWLARYTQFEIMKSSCLLETSYKLLFHNKLSVSYLQTIFVTLLVLIYVQTSNTWHFLNWPGI